MNGELKAMACLLIYPRRQLIDDLEEIRNCLLSSTRLTDSVKETLKHFIGDLAAAPLLQLQKLYVYTFDTTKSASLNLFEHLHKESRNRGPAMINLLALYEEHGLSFESDELPDFLPAVLEFLSGLSERDARIWLESATPLIGSIHKELCTLQSPWSAVTEALLNYGNASPMTEEKREPTPPELETDYYDRPVTFGNRTGPTTETLFFIPSTKR